MDISDHQLLQHKLFRIRHTELNEIFLVMSLRSFVTAMISIFVPIYLYNLGFSLTQIFWLQIAMFATEFVTERFSSIYISHYGPKHAIALSMPPLIAHFWLLSTITTYHWPLWFIGFCGGFCLALYWQGYHYDFSKSKHKGKETDEVSKMYIVIAVVGAIAPLVGGLIASSPLGFNGLYLIVIGLLLLVFVPLLQQGEKHMKRKLDFHRVKTKLIWRDLISYGGMGVEASASLIIWPLFVYFIVKSYQSVGLVTSLALIITIVVTFYVGRKVNNSNRHAYIKAGSLLDGITYVLLVFVDTFTQVLSLNVARSLVSSLRQAPYTSEYYLHADEQSRPEYIYYMESTIDLFRLNYFVILFLLATRLPVETVLVIGLILGAIGSVLGALIPRSKCELPYCNSNSTIKFIPKLRTKSEAS